MKYYNGQVCRPSGHSAEVLNELEIIITVNYEIWRERVRIRDGSWRGMDVNLLVRLLIIYDVL